MNIKITPRLQLALDFVETTGKNIFLTGKAGTGKTTFLHYLKQTTSKRMVVVAPTGVAAINAGGVTIHSFFQLSFGPQLPYSAKGSNNEGSRIQRFSKIKINIIKSLDLLVIDEVSMVRSDLLDGIDSVLRRFKDKTKPFGGVQLLMIGDLQQLAPIAKDDEWAILSEYYDTIYFFSSRALKQTNFVSIELNDIFRQSDEQFISLLNKVRNNQLNANDVEMLNQRYIANFAPADSEGYITLTTHNHQAQSLNARKLKELKTEPHTFTATVKGDFPEHAYPTDYELTLKVGAQVMFVKNDPTYEKLFFNGKIGTVEDIDEEGIYVQCPGDASAILVTPLEWENTNYTIDPNTKEIKEKVTGEFKQYPLKLAWAITIHKSQGLTFDKAIIDAQAAFAHGQVYVALSRCRSLNGLVLSSKVNTNAIITDKTVTGFSEDVEKNQPDQTQLTQAQVDYQRDMVLDLFNFDTLNRTIGYTNIKLLAENASSFPPKLAETFSALAGKFNIEIFDVSNKFRHQIQKIVLESNSVQNNAALQERIVKAVAYFLPKLNDEFLPAFTNSNYESDSIELESKAKEQLDRITKGIAEKIICLTACEKGFDLLSYLDTRAKAAIDEVKKKKTKAPAKVPAAEIDHPELFERLHQWRHEVAQEQNVKVYRILRQNTLYDIVNQLPYHKALLKPIKGLGPKKIADFGNDIIDIVRSFMNEKDIPIPEADVFEEPKKEAKPKTWEISYNLFQQGKTIAQIAQERALAESTVAGHLTRYLSSGDIEVKQLVPPEKIETITEYFCNASSLQLTPAKETLGDNYSYNELRWVLKHLINIGKVQVLE